MFSVDRSVDISNALSFGIIATLLVISPGPNGVLILKTVPGSGRLAGFANIGGFVFAFYVHGLLSIFGISIILVQSANAFMIVKLLGAGYLCWIGIKALIEGWRLERWRSSAPSSHQARDVRSGLSSRLSKAQLGKAFAEGFLTNALNPKVSMFYLSAFPQFISPTEGAPIEALTLVSLHAFINVIWFSSLILLFKHLIRSGGRPRFQRWLKSVTGLVFIGFGLKLAMMKP